MFVVHSTLYFWIFIIVFAAVIALYGFKGWFKLTSDNLYGQPLFWLSILGPLFSCFYFGVPVWSQSSFLISAAGYQHFYDISKIPLLLLASAVPFTAIIVSLHRTVQVEKQIATAEFKNKMDSYYAHNKYVTEAFSKISPAKPPFKRAQLHCLADDTSHQIIRPYALYKRVFPDSNANVGAKYGVNEKFINAVVQRFTALEKELYNLDEKFVDKFKNNTAKKTESDAIMQVRGRFFDIASLFQFNKRPKDINLFHTDMNNGPDIIAIMYEIRAYYYLTHKLCTEALDVIGVNNRNNKNIYAIFKRIFAYGDALENYVVKGTPFPDAVKQQAQSPANPPAAAGNP